MSFASVLAERDALKQELHDVRNELGRTIQRQELEILKLLAKILTDDEAYELRRLSISLAEADRWLDGIEHDERIRLADTIARLLDRDGAPIVIRGDATPEQMASLERSRAEHQAILLDNVDESAIEKRSGFSPETLASRDAAFAGGGGGGNGTLMFGDGPTIKLPSDPCEYTLTMDDMRFDQDDLQRFIDAGWVIRNDGYRFFVNPKK